MPFKTFNVPSFFAGVGTVLAILVVGFGGGVMMSGVVSDTSRKPNKVERQAAVEMRDAKPGTPPVAPIVTQPAPSAPVVAATESSPLQAMPAPGPAAADAVSAPAAAQSTPQPDPQPAAQAQAAPPPAPLQAQAVPPPQTQLSVAQSERTTLTPSLGPQRSVSLTQPPREREFDPAQLSRRDQARYWREQRHQDRAQRREERRKEFAERRQQEQSRREEMRPAVERMRPRDRDDDDDEPRLVPMRPRGLFDGLFGGTRNGDD